MVAVRIFVDNIDATNMTTSKHTGILSLTAATVNKYTCIPAAPRRAARILIRVHMHRRARRAPLRATAPSGLINRGSSSCSLVVTFFRHNFAENGLQDLKMV
jgi:hypothetical protein